MSSTVRYKNVVNTTGAALLSSAISDRDGDDKQVKIVRRVLAAADIGTNAGQTRDVGGDGALVCKIDKATNILSVQGWAYRAGRLIDNLIHPDAVAANIVQASISYEVYGAENPQEVRVIDAGAVGGVQLAAGDVIILAIVIGTNPTD